MPAGRRSLELARRRAFHRRALLASPAYPLTCKPLSSAPVMTFLGIELRRPTFNEVTAATVMAVGLWVAVIGLAQVSGHALQARDAGALLVVSVWGCIGARVGVGIGKGGRHLAAHVGINAVLLALYQGALVLAS